MMAGIDDGPYIALWDWIMDAEAILAGRKPGAMREQVEAHLKTVIERHSAQEGTTSDG